jgi:DNA-binding PucR family transcriptional regulator
MRKTLRTYMDHGCNATSTATSLGVDRHTIQRRLRRAEEVLGRRVDACRSELEVALHLEQLGEGTARS